MNRICPSDFKLSAYLGHSLDPVEKDSMEIHLAGCSRCRKLISETHEVLSGSVPGRRLRSLRQWLRGNRWFLGSALAIALSFFFPKYFLQFLSAGVLMGIKWISDSRTSRILIMVREAWRHNDKKSAEKIFSDFDLR